MVAGVLVAVPGAAEAADVARVRGAGLAGRGVLGAVRRVAAERRVVGVELEHRTLEGVAGVVLLVDRDAAALPVVEGARDGLARADVDRGERAAVVAAR